MQYNNENNLSRGIEKYILELLEEQTETDENFVSLRRKDLAEMFGCVPSQINYVLRSRFSPERGYLIESRRGEYGYIKILRITHNVAEEKIDYINEIVGDEISLKSACRFLEFLNERELITNRERLLIEIALKNQNRTLNNNASENRADLLKKMLSALLEI